MPRLIGWLARGGSSKPSKRTGRSGLPVVIFSVTHLTGPLHRQRFVGPAQNWTHRHRSRFGGVADCECERLCKWTADEYCAATQPMSAVTVILSRAQQGDPKAAAELLPLVYDELRRVAANNMAREASHQTLQPTALVHEAWLRLNGGDESQRWDGRAHFFAAAAEAMRRILIDRARSKQALRHGGGHERVEAAHLDIAAPAPDDELIALSDALDRFAVVDGPKAELVKLRYFVGMTLEEAATALNISEPTAKRWWAYSRAWLFSEIRSRK